jgi:diguanylate cyclase (GGDEF)-like protein
MPKLTTFPLHKQLLRPLIVLLLVLAGTSVVGSSLLLHNSLTDAIDIQLAHAQKMVYQDLKERELQLAELLISLALKEATIPTSTLEQEVLTYQPLPELRLFDAHDDLGSQHRKLVDAVNLSRTPLRQITYDEHEKLYFLTLAQPVAAPRDLLLLEFPINQKLLKNLAERYLCDLSVYSKEGRLMVSSNRKNPDPQLPADLLTRIADNNHQYNSKIENIDSRSLYAPLPLGSEGVLYLAASKPLDSLNSLLTTHSWRLLLTVALALAIGTRVYYRLLLRTLSPLKKLFETIHLVAQGNLSCRTEINTESHLHNLSSSFNQMLEKIESLYKNRLESEKSSVVTQETQKFNNHLKKQNLAIEKANIQLKEQYEELSALFQISRSLTSVLDQNLLFEKVFSVLRDRLRCDHIVLLLYLPGSESLEVKKTTGLDAGTENGLSFNLGEGISGLAAANMSPIYSNDLSADDRNLNYKGRWVTSGSLLSVPMVLQNRLIGVLNIHHSQKDAFDPVAQQMAQAIADQTAISIENSRLYEKTRTLSATDDLTGLANRRQFQDYLQREWEQSRRYHSTFSLLMLDIDHFKDYNDTHGHLKGDIALKKVAALLMQYTRGIDLVARFGGEEFVVLLPKADKEGSLAVANKLCRCIEDEHFNGMEESQPQKKLTVSIGTSTFPSDSTDIYDLLNLADDALYKAKRNGRNHARAWSRKATPKTEATPQPTGPASA